MPQLLERVNFPKVVTVLAVSLGVGLGLCGLNFVAVSALGGGSGGIATALITTAWLELLVMVLSAVGLVVALAMWGAVKVIHSHRSAGSGPQRLFDGDDEKGHQP
ncbi:MAG TPA: hypothetical protein VMD92_15855 [Acidobacteriaceae bacterium]|nr:hypothetical protein [Acidobacteriaceae bacterium]HTW49429.1 hypothetical protein [Acidobacteriaceae bacterium]